MNTSYLVGAFLLAGVVLVTGAVLASFLSSDLNDSEEANCPEPAPAVSRDEDAQILVDRVDRATTAAHGVRSNVQLHSITIFSNGEPFFTFVAKDRPPVLVSFGTDGEPRARDAQVRFPDSPGAELTLDDLTLGPNRARSIVQAQYPSAQIGGLGLTRQENCELAWAVGGIIPQEGRPPLELRAAVDNATAQVSLPEGPPRQLGGR